MTSCNLFQLKYCWTLDWSVMIERLSLNSGSFVAKFILQGNYEFVGWNQWQLQMGLIKLSHFLPPPPPFLPKPFIPGLQFPVHPVQCDRRQINFWKGYEKRVHATNLFSPRRLPSSHKRSNDLSQSNYFFYTLIDHSNDIMKCSKLKWNHKTLDEWFHSKIIWSICRLLTVNFYSVN